MYRQESLPLPPKFDFYLCASVPRHHESLGLQKSRHCLWASTFYQCHFDIPDIPQLCCLTAWFQMEYIKAIWWGYCNGPGPLWGEVCLFGQVSVLRMVHSGTRMTEKMNMAQDTLHMWVVTRRAGKCSMAMLGEHIDDKKSSRQTACSFASGSTYPPVLLLWVVLALTSSS